MKTYRLPCDWQISMPDHWQGEYDKDDGQCVFYPDKLVYNYYWQK